MTPHTNSGAVLQLYIWRQIRLDSEVSVGIV